LILALLSSLSFILQVGDAGERPLGPWLADAAGEEASLDAASCQLQAFPHNGDQPQGTTYQRSV